MRLARLAPVAALAVALAVPASSKAVTPGVQDIRKGLQGIVNASEGPPGAIATLYRDGKLTVVRAGRADVERRGAPKPADHMRIASVAKAFSGAVALHLVQEGKLGLDDTIGRRLANMPKAWHAVTLRQLLDHTSGVPDYTASAGFANSSRRAPARTCRRPR